MLGHLGSYVAYLATRGARERSDHAAAAQLAWDRVGAALPAGVSLRWVGTSGFRLEHEGTVLWIDPYLTRLPLGAFVRRRVVPPSDAAVARHVDRADAVLIGHTHFDHALDAPAIAARTGCRVFGSTSMTHLMQLHGRADQAVTVEPYRVYEIGPFAVTFVPSVHSKLALGLRVPSGGELTCEHLDELTPQAYRCGQVWGIHVAVAGATFYHQGSADLIEDALRHRGVDYFLCGIAGRRFTRDYVARILRKLEPRVIIPTHYDDFFRPLEDPLAFSMNVNLGHFADEVRAVSADFQLAALPRAGASAALTPGET